MKLPKVADSVDEVVVTSVLVTTGQRIEAGDPLLLVETDKAQVEVPCPVPGIVSEILVSVDDEISTGTYVVVLEVD